MSSPMKDKILEAKAQGRTALIPYLPAGYPDRDQFWKELEMLDAAGAAIIEIGMPFSDPVADGPVVEAACLQVLEDGINLTWIFDGLKKRKGTLNAGLLLMGYLNPVLQYGVERFAEDCEAAGVSGLIIADMPIDEADFVIRAMKPRGVELIPLVGLNTSKERMKLYAKEAEGFVYMVSVLGTTGQRDSLPTEIKAKLTEAKEVFDIPVALGFGLKTPSQLTPFGDLVDAAVVGSSLISHIRDGGTAASYMKAWT
ncbi:tryptophan synthase subunit alpha [Salidesulfovibrio onnuriiensis]|uniref:tryptophan synthase subunit alpha n=1 Tax=Salidesulfovibrio onnuriiensis TaxID=2583823 RepID=UPI0011CCC48E|nr:tryptophan synthase subunit alpha [Salidesulfovibrio onnuriiensis]